MRNKIKFEDIKATKINHIKNILSLGLTFQKLK